MADIIKLPRHEHRPDDIVYVLNNAANGGIIVEGKARIEKRLDDDHLYEVRFIQEPDAAYDRYVRPGDQRMGSLLRTSAANARDAG